jgi:phosphatidylglycerophosphatase A
VHRLIASSFGLGLVPRRLWKSDAGAGTFGAALGAGIGAILLWVGAPWWAGALAAAAAIGASLWSATPYGRHGEDPGWVCMDETAGTLVAVVGLGGWPWVAAVVVARLLDIVKVAPGVREAERLPGAIGITADDVVAGFYGLVVGWALVGMGV